MKKRAKPDPYKTDDENPEWTAADFRRARPAREIVPHIVKAYEAGTLRVRGRPKSSQKTAVSLRLDNDIVAALRASGEGWQTRVNDALRDMINART
ncbi:MAG: BrnA antitoxin family protein [Alphaproteobacteria bacterium]|nr:BrnA antitoxin family protein [Alphaproteobacteria bacterium]